MIDSKRYVVKAPEKRLADGLFQPRVESLMVRGRDKTSLVDGVCKQVKQVRGVVGDVPVTDVLFFVDASWPPFAEPSTIKGVQVLWPKKLVGRVKRRVDPVIDIPAVTEALYYRFVPVFRSIERCQNAASAGCVGSCSASNFPVARPSGDRAQPRSR